MPDWANNAGSSAAQGQPAASSAIDDPFGFNTNTSMGASNGGVGPVPQGDINLGGVLGGIDFTTPGGPSEDFESSQST